MITKIGLDITSGERYIMDNTFLKWAGGKNWFVRHQANRIPQQYNRYIDPFLGGGSLYFYLEPQQAIINDINEELVTTFRALKDDWETVERNLKIHAYKHNEEYYYLMRKRKTQKDATTAARMIYLNRTCFNGIYRVNASGKFNVPIGTHNNVILSTDEFQKRSLILQNAKILCGDFEQVIDMALYNDFLFCDPPYAVLNEEHRFVGYTRQTFDWNDQVRLANALERARLRGVKIIMTNVNHQAVRQLYPNNHYLLEEVTRFSSISGKKKGRQQYSELIVSANI